MKKILLSFLLLLAGFSMARADIVEVGTDEFSTVIGPIRSSWKYSLAQQIYTIADIGSAGDIQSISYWAGTGANGLARKFDLYLVETDQDEFEATLDAESGKNLYNWISFGESDKVFSGEVTFNAYDWTTIKFDEPFYYSGKKNLAIIANNYTGANYSSFYWGGFDASKNQTLMATMTILELTT